MRFPAAIAAAIATNATRFGLDSLLVAAVVMQESSGDPCALRREPAYRWFVGPDGLPCVEEQVRGLDGVSDADEVRLQRSSLGLMQVMGAVAREAGLRTPRLDDPEHGLFNPLIGCEYGCRHLQRAFRRFGDEESALSAYNAGRPTISNRQTYVEPILAMREELRQEGGF